MSRVNVAVLRGGPSNEYDVSLATGAAVLAHLPEERYATKDILIGKDGTWHARGIPTTPDRALQDVDVAFIALHGEYGEDGTVQKMLDAHKIPYTGSGVFPSAIAMDKGRARAHLSSLAGVKMPQHATLHAVDIHDSLHKEAEHIFYQFGPPYIVKPLRGGSSVGIAIAHSILELADALDEVFGLCDAVIIEQFIHGKEGTCGVVDELRGERVYALPPIEIVVPEGKRTFDYEAKYDGTTQELCPAESFSQHEKETLQHAARAVHEQLGLSHYSRSDFIIAPSGVYFLEVNTLPALRSSTTFLKSTDAVGLRFSDFLTHTLQQAMKAK